ncbi:MAG: BON domain-containing protein [Nitrospinaceae bacterium]|jgi:cytidylate kinase|nr:BON domain-containing protein [Nitrospinaceae bacterium]MBT3433764.1 BON domain-containing protein [Nitrospinaceae bacterium]MBT3821751.1 BON domain-containing protein [Nitrospinaceae bacterium]MBT4095570.1 BON domain-containing protein [Nitrospinaceae bacterium]MBT4431160.1 BON domain-containing protein [Nitrospinaceae bacterium]
MGVLTLSRELGSGGDAIGKKVARELNWTLLDINGFAEAARSYGYVRDELERVDERSPGLVDRFFRDRQLVYLDIMRAIVYECAIKDNYVILGRGGNSLLASIPGVMRVRVVAPDNIRQHRLVANEGISGAMAEEFLRHNDQERESYTRYFFDVQWGDPGNFDLVLNTGFYDEDAVVRIIVKILKGEKFSTYSPSSSTVLRNLSFAQKVKAALMTDDRVDASGISVECPNEGDLILRGRVNSEDEKDLSESIASSFEGVGSLDSELVVMPPIEGWYPV